MKKRPAKPAKSTAALPSDIKARMQAARIKAGLAANRELPALQRDAGRLIVSAQRTKGYGRQVVGRIALDVQREIPGIAGFSALNVWRMRVFYAAYVSASEIVSQAVTESSGPPEPFASLPRAHNLLLLHKPEKPADRSGVPPRPSGMAGRATCWPCKSKPLCTPGRAWRSRISRRPCRRPNPTSPNSSPRTPACLIFPPCATTLTSAWSRTRCAPVVEKFFVESPRSRSHRDQGHLGRRSAPSLHPVNPRKKCSTLFEHIYEAGVA
jgi:hypothetical protein